ncbi:MAG: non-canonical purine NTP pyrophosphatase [Candidatus Gracilibacteria bacterium]|nr:non-canonical purine NTP pyrophosphatase [Candidatus Gracilibacteria bacterium]
MLDKFSRNTTARCVVGYYDGENLELFVGFMDGKIATKPSGNGGFGFDPIFIPDGYDITRADMTKEDDEKTYFQIKPYYKLKQYLEKDINNK